MLELKVFNGESYETIKFEHSLLSISKWESRTKKPFLTLEPKTAVDSIDYFQDMIIDGSDPNLVLKMTPEQLEQLSDYINEPQTASSVPHDPRATGHHETVTSELIYYWMTALQIDWRAEAWPLSRLMMVIEITNYKNQPEKERSRGDMLARWRQENTKRKEEYNTNG